MKQLPTGKIKLWHTAGSNTYTPINELSDKYLQELERWMRGGGNSNCLPEIKAEWYTDIRAEFDKRELAMLPDHKNRVDTQTNYMFSGTPFNVGPPPSKDYTRFYQGPTENFPRWHKPNITVDINTEQTELNEQELEVIAQKMKERVDKVINKFLYVEFIKD